MKNLELFEEITEAEESTIQGGRTDLILGGQTIQLTGNPTLPWGAYLSFPLALSFTPGTINFAPGFGLKFSVAQISDVPSFNFLSGGAGPFTSLLGPNGLAGVLGLNTSANVPA